MGKKKGKKNDEKKATLQAKKDAKADKAARKRLQKESSKAAAASSSSSSDPKAAGSAPPPGAAASLDDLLQVYRQKDIAGSKAIVEVLPGYPPARGNATLTLCEGDQKGKQDLYLFGGEYFDGVENVVLDHLLRWDVKNEHWKHILTPSASPAPPPRCAHSTIYYNGALYVFGGELATTDHYHHYKDLWRFDIGKQTWEELTSRTGSVPSSRSGHSAVVWKYFMIIFGGFYEALRDTPRWFNDFFAFNLQTQQWVDIPHSKLATRPEARSACNVALIGDTAVVHGGYSKLSASSAAQGRESKVHTDSWILHLKPLLQGKPPTWERLMSSGGRGGNKNPNGRSGTASVAYKNRMLVYGGVFDSELMHHKVDSVFYNDLFAFDMDQRKWFPLRLRKGKHIESGRRRQQAGSEDQGDVEEAGDLSSERKGEEAEDQNETDDEDNDAANDLLEEDLAEDGEAEAAWDLEKLRSNMFAFIDGSGNIVYENIEDDEEEKEEEKEQDHHQEEEKDADEEKEEEEEEEKVEHTSSDSSSVEGNVEANETKGQPAKDIVKHAEPKKKIQISPNVKIISSSSVMTMNPETKTPEAVERAEPLPRINASLVVRGHTLFVYGGLLEIGDREVTLDDMWSLDLRKRDKWECLWPGTIHNQVWRGGAHDDDDSYISSTAGEDEDDEEGSDNSDDDEVSARGKQKGGRVVNARQDIAELNDKYGLGDVSRTPQMGEVLADFYARTSEYWNGQAVEQIKASGSNEEPSNKELKREGFSLARQRFEDLEGVMERLKELDLQHQPDKARVEKKGKPKKNKK